MTRASRLLARLDEFARATTRITDHTGYSYNIHHDPTPSRIKSIAANAKFEDFPLPGGGTGHEKTIRILHDPKEGTVHMWDGFDAVHDEAATNLGLSEPLNRYVMTINDKNELSVEKTLMDQPKLYQDIKAALGYPKRFLG